MNRSLNKIEDLAQPIGFYFESRTQQHSHFTRRHTFAMEPFQVINRQIANQCAFIFAKRHFGLNHLFQDFWVGLNIFHCTNIDALPANYTGYIFS
jgi:hypothetical protein